MASCLPSPICGSPRLSQSQVAVSTICHGFQVFGPPNRLPAQILTGLLTDASPEVEDLFAPLKDLQFEYPSLDDFQYGPLEAISAPESLPGSIEPEEEEKLEITEDDIWQLNLDADFDFGEPRLKTWETFESATHVEPSVYLSEAGPRTFDAWLASSKATTVFRNSRNDATSCIVRVDPLLKSVLSLCLGRESAIFKYDIPRKTFCVRFDGMLLSGYSPETINSVTKRFIDGGNKLRAIDTFIQKVYGLHGANSTAIAFAHALSAVVTHLRAHVLAVSGSVQSILHLQLLITSPFIVVSNLQSLVERLKGVHAAQEILTILFEYIQQQGDLDLFFRPILLQILAKVSVPWMRSLETSIGLRLSSLSETLDFHNAAEFQVKALVDEKNDAKNFTTILSDEDNMVVEETSRSWLLAQTHMPNHILSRLNGQISGHPSSLEWGFGWKDMERIQAKAVEYEQSILEAMSSPILFDSGAKRPHNPEEKDDTHPPFALASDEMEGYIAASQAALERSLPDPLRYDSNDAFASACHAALSVDFEKEYEFTPPLAIIPSLSFSPMIAAQACLMNLACLRLVFIEHKLQQHLSIQRRFQLFGDGVFASRLSHALFDPELPTSQRRKGRTRDGTMGLNLGFRNTWPPATSELSLALMGILKDSLRSSEDQRLIGRDGELPGGLSFSIRNLSEEQIQRCLDPDSVEALDFLYLQYKPPPPLDTVFTQSCLEKYDRMFKLLLRVTRMMSVVTELHIDSVRRHRLRRQKPSVAIERFHMDAYHFVSIISAYFYHDGIIPIWSVFEQSLNNIAARIRANVQVGDISEHDGLDQVKNHHEKTLDHMTFALLSRKRQAKAMHLLEEIFRSILIFAKESRKPGPDIEFTIKSLYETFKTNVGAFILSCRELSAKKGMGAKYVQDNAKGTLFSQRRGDTEQGSSTLDHLFLKLEMNGYFSRFCKAEPTLDSNP